MRLQDSMGTHWFKECQTAHARTCADEQMCRKALMSVNMSHNKIAVGLELHVSLSAGDECVSVSGGLSC